MLCYICSYLIYYFRGLTSEEAQLEYVIITQKMEGYGDEYYPAKVTSSMFRYLYVIDCADPYIPSLIWH